MNRPGWSVTGLKPKFSVPIRDVLVTEGPETNAQRARSLRLVTETFEPIDDNGYFNKDQATTVAFYAACTSLHDSLRDSPAGSPEAAEASNALKQISQTGQRGYSFMMNNQSPFVSLSLNVKFPIIDVTPFALLFSSILDDGDLQRFAPSRVFSAGAMRYRKGSNYGPFPVVSGVSKANGATLMCHALQSDLWVRHMSKTGRYTSADHIFGDVWGGKVDVRHPDAAQLFSRTGAIGPNKPIPHWHIDQGAFIAEEASSGIYARMRPIQAINATRNMSLSGIAATFTNLYKRIPGCHVGHPALASVFLYEAASKLRKPKYYAEDLSNYDQTVSPGLRAFFIALCEKMFSLTGWEMDLLRSMDDVGVYSVMGKGASMQRVLWTHRGGVATGSQLTTAEGTTMNMMTLVWAMAKIKGIEVQTCLEQCHNFRSFFPNSKTSWAFLIKGDDLVILYDEGLDLSGLTDLRADVGLVSKEEEALIFLKNFIITDKEINSSDLTFCPHHVANKPCFETYGMVSQRLGGFGFPEYAVKSDAIAVVASAERHRTVVRSPLYPTFVGLLADALPQGMKHFADYNWLQAEIADPLFRAKLDLELRASGRKIDPFVREMVRRTSLSDEDADVSGGRESDLGFLTGLRDLAISHGFGPLPDVGPASRLFEEQGDRVGYGSKELPTADLLRMARELAKHVWSRIGDDPEITEFEQRFLL